MEWEGCECSKCVHGREEWPSPSPPLALSSRSDSSEVGGDSGDSCREVSRDGVAESFLASGRTEPEDWDAWPEEAPSNSIHEPCPNAFCRALLPRHCLLTHRPSCIYAPTAYCPGDACGFVGSAEALLDHFISVKKWPYTAEIQAEKSFTVRLWGGFNVLGAVRGTTQHLLVLYVARRPYGSTLSATCICPQPEFPASPETLKCKLQLRFPATYAPQTSEYKVRTSFDVPRSSPFDGFPSPDDFFQFFVPKSVHSDANAAIRVTASITIYWGH